MLEREMCELCGQPAELMCDRCFSAICEGCSHALDTGESAVCDWCITEDELDNHVEVI